MSRHFSYFHPSFSAPNFLLSKFSTSCGLWLRGIASGYQDFRGTCRLHLASGTNTSWFCKVFSRRSFIIGNRDTVTRSWVLSAPKISIVALFSDAVQSCRWLPTFRRNIPPPFSGWIFDIHTFSLWRTSLGSTIYNIQNSNRNVRQLIHHWL
jgi:hypothetical protein